ncbi:MAG: fibronectin type III domain-containing protein [Clostridia bacterium]|nr:fibronectin type III domain-containing protein [Clostridia bacterium]
MMKSKLMKKALACLLAVVMVCTLFVPGTVTAFASGTVLNVTSAAELGTALNQNEEVDAIHITESFAIYEDFSILFDAMHLNYYHDTVMTIDAGVTLTIGNGGVIGSMWSSYQGDGETPPFPNGSVVNNGTIIVEAGGATEADFDVNNGTILVKRGGSAVCCNTNNGTVTVEAGGQYVTTQGGQAINNGLIQIQSGAAMESRMGTPIVNAEGGTIELNGEFNCGCIGDDGADDFWFSNEGTVTGNGNIVLYEAAHEFMPVSDMDALIEAMMVQLGQTSRFENWDDVNIYKLVSASDYITLKEALAFRRTVAGEAVEGNMDTIVKLSADIEIPASERIEAMAKLIVSEGVNVAINSGATLSCGIDNRGTITVLPGGNLLTTQGGNIENFNTITVGEEAFMKSQMGGEIINHSGATLLIDGTCCCGCIGLDGNDISWFKNEGDCSGAGTILLYEAAHEWMPIADKEALIAKVQAQLSGGAVPMVVAELEHEWGPWVKTKDATCTQPGEGASTCAICGETITQVFPALGHEYKATKTVAPTATALGYTIYTCARQDCGDSYKAAYKAPTGKQTLKCKARTKQAQTMTWNSVKNASGYQVQISTKDGKKWSTYATLKAGVTAYTFKNLAAGNNYKFRVRFYIKATDGKYYYSPWSATLNSPTLPAGTSFSKVTGTKRAFTAQWKKQTNATGYQIEYSTKSNFSGSKKVTVRSVKTLKATVKNLSAKKVYYVRVRTYKTISKVHYFSTWSNAVKVKTK